MLQIRAVEEEEQADYTVETVFRYQNLGHVSCQMKVLPTALTIGGDWQD